MAESVHPRCAQCGAEFPWHDRSCGQAAASPFILTPLGTDYAGAYRGSPVKRMRQD